jgi:hypothetical protein
LARLLGDLPDEALVPVGWVRRQLEAHAAPSSDPLGDYTVATLAEKLERAPSTVRGWLIQGDFPGAYHVNGREWRVPPASVAAWREAQRTGKKPTEDGPVDLGAWRKHRRGA